LAKQEVEKFFYPCTVLFLTKPLTKTVNNRMPGRAAVCWRVRQPRQNCTASAKSILVTAATSALLRIVEYFNGLFSPAVKGIVQVDHARPATISEQIS
jgi:hypothetical protein